MKPSKEAVVGVLAALEEWQAMDRAKWAADQATKVAGFVAVAGEIPGVVAEVVPDPTSLPLSRALLKVADAPGLARELEAGSPPIYVMTERADAGELMLELLPLDDAEIELVIARLWALLDK
jgi:L-seryl-tRNA(Ser) seleniumtransferase